MRAIYRACGHPVLPETVPVVEAQPPVEAPTEPIDNAETPPSTEPE